MPDFCLKKKVLDNDNPLPIMKTPLKVGFHMIEKIATQNVERSSGLRLPASFLQNTIMMPKRTYINIH